jgi:hypothetical protein
VKLNLVFHFHVHSRELPFLVFPTYDLFTKTE